MITPKMREGMRRLTGVGKITHTDKDYITALTDLHEKRPSSGRGAVEMRAKIDAYLDEKLAGDEKAELSPGAFKTKFKHVIRVDTNEPLAAGDATYQTDSAVRHALISHALGHATDGNKAIVCNVFTMNDVLTGHDPSIGSTLEQLQVPFVGIDGHGNPAFLLHHQHSGNKDLMDRLGQSHSDSVTPALQNKNAWNCAAWLSAFLQFKSGDLAKSLSPPDDFDPALRERLIKVAELARTAEGLNAITGQDPAADNSAQPAEFKLQYPANFDDDTFKGNILEKDLMDATAILLKGRKDIFGVELLFPKNKKFNSSHVFSVMNALGVKAVIHGDGTGVEGALVDTISCSHPSVMAHLDAMKWEDKQSHVVEMAELCKEVPILVRLGERGYALRMPKATPGAAGAPDKDNQKASGETCGFQSSPRPAGFDHGKSDDVQEKLQGDLSDSEDKQTSEPPPAVERGQGTGGPSPVPRQEGSVDDLKGSDPALQPKSTSASLSQTPTNHVDHSALADPLGNIAGSFENMLGQKGKARQP